MKQLKSIDVVHGFPLDYRSPHGSTQSDWLVYDTLEGAFYLYRGTVNFTSLNKKVDSSIKVFSVMQADPENTGVMKDCLIIEDERSETLTDVYWAYIDDPEIVPFLDAVRVAYGHEDIVDAVNGTYGIVPNAAPMEELWGSFIPRKSNDLEAFYETHENGCFIEFITSGMFEGNFRLANALASPDANSLSEYSEAYRSKYDPVLRRGLLELEESLKQHVADTVSPVDEVHKVYPITQLVDGVLDDVDRYLSIGVSTDRRMIYLQAKAAKDYFDGDTSVPSWVANMEMIVEGDAIVSGMRIDLGGDLNMYSNDHQKRCGINLTAESRAARIIGTLPLITGSSELDFRVYLRSGTNTRAYHFMYNAAHGLRELSVEVSGDNFLEVK